MSCALRHAGLVVADLPRMRRFYETVFGFRTVGEALEEGPFVSRLLGLDGCRVTTVKMAAPRGGALLELLHFHQPRNEATERAGPATPGWTHLALTVDDIDESCRQLTGNGGETLSGPLPSPDGKVRVTYARDPEANLLELVEVRGA